MYNIQIINEDFWTKNANFPSKVEIGIFHLVTFLVFTPEILFLKLIFVSRRLLIAMPIILEYNIHISNVI